MHLHGDNAGHMALSPADRDTVLRLGWGIPHPLAGNRMRLGTMNIPPTLVMIFSPRDEEEQEVVWRIVQASHRWATTGL